MKNVYISMLTFNDNLVTWDCLDSLEKLKKDNINLFVIVVDNASADKFYAKKDYANFNLTILRNEENLGFSGGQNEGIKFAVENGADFVNILNNDTIVDSNLITELLKGFKDNVGVVVPKIYFAKGHEYHKDRYSKENLGKVIWYAGGFVDWDNIFGKHRGVDEVDKGQYDAQEETELATGCCMMLSREVIEKIGVFDDKFFLYYEDGDLCVRIKKAGFKIMFAPKGILWHINAAATGGSGSPLQDYYISRNRMLFGLRYASFQVKLALFRESIKILRSGRPWQKIGVKDFYLNKFGKGSYSK